MRPSIVRRLALFLLPLALGLGLAVAIHVDRRPAEERPIGRTAPAAGPETPGPEPVALPPVAAPSKPAPAGPVPLPPAPGRIGLGEPRAGLYPLEGVWHYDGAGYGASFGADGAAFAPSRPIPGRGRPALRYRFEELRVGDALVARGGPVAPQADAATSTVAYLRGGVEERYTLRDRAGEQDFVIRSLPEGRGAITVTGRVETSLDAPADGTEAPRLSFTRDGREVVFMDEAVAVDAEGRRLPLRLAYAGGRVSMTVPSGWVAEARLPIVVDPLIGTPITLFSGSMNHTPTNPVNVAYNAVRNEWMATWMEYYGATRDDLKARRVAADGSLGATITVAATLFNDTNVAIAHAPDVDRYMVSWIRANPNYDVGELQACLLNGDGSFHAGPFVVQASAGYGHGDPFLAYNGAGAWYLMWRDGATFGLRGRFYSTSGAAGASADPDPNLGTYSHAAVLSDGIFVLAWVRGSPAMLVTRRMSPGGTFLDAGPLSVSSSPVFGVRVAPGNGGRFLFLYGEPAGSTSTTARFKYRIGTASSASSMTWSTGENVIYSTVGPDYAVQWDFASAHAANGDEWLIAYKKGTSPGLFGRRLSSAGTLTGEETWVPSPNNPFRPHLAYNTATTESLLVYSNNAQQAMAQRVYGAPPPAPPPTPPAAPASLTASAGNGKITLSWPAVSGAEGYSVRRSTVSGGPYEDFENGMEASTNGFVDTSVFNLTRYYYVVRAYNSGGSSGSSPQASAIPKAPAPPRALLVVGNTTLGAGDKAVRDRLDAHGYIVDVVADATATSSSASGKALVFISATVTAANVNTKFRTTTVPVVVCENAVLDDMGMTGATAGTHYGTATGQTQVNIVNGSHALAGGLGAGAKTVCSSSTFAWGKPQLSTGAAPTIVARLTSGDLQRAAIFGYAKGAAMAGLTAPGRRVGFFLESTTASVLSADGLKLLDAAIRWAANRASGPASPSSVEISQTAVASGAKAAKITWAPVDGAVTYNVLRATSAAGPYTRVATGLNTLEYYNTGLSDGVTYHFRVEAVNASGLISFSTGSTTFVQSASDVYVAGITGPAFIRAWRPGQTTRDFWNEGLFRVHIYRRDSNGNYHPVTTGISHPVWSKTPLYSGNQVSPRLTPSADALQSTCTVSADTEEAKIEDYSRWRLNYIAVRTGTTLTVNASAEFVVTSRRYLYVHCVFPKPPGNGPGKTERPWGGGSPNGFFIEGDANGNGTPDRLEARRDFLINFLGTTTGITRNAGLTVYWSVNDDTPEIKGFRTDGLYAYKYDDANLNPDYRAEALNGDATALRIYFVKGLATPTSAGTVAYGTTYVPPVPKGTTGYGRAIFMGDNGDTQTMAHELIHAVGHGHHIDKWGDLTGKLNNLKDVMTDKLIEAWPPNITTEYYPLNWNLMRAKGDGRLPDSRGNWLTDTQGKKMYASAGSSPFYFFED